MLRTQHLLNRIAVGLVALSATFVAIGTTPSQAASDPSWYIRLKVDNYANKWSYDGALFGQQPGAKTTWDAQDLPAMAPFSSPYLYLTFPRPTWGAKAGDYATEFRPSVARTAGDWPFELRASNVGTTVYLRRDGDTAILKRSLLIESATGKAVSGIDPRWSGQGIPIKITATAQKYIWRYLGP